MFAVGRLLVEAHKSPDVGVSVGFIIYIQVFAAIERVIRTFHYIEAKSKCCALVKDYVQSVKHFNILHPV